jgi:hypothetical protein
MNRQCVANCTTLIYDILGLPGMTGMTRMTGKPKLLGHAGKQE